jgi:retron-type reverse transcriptase
LGGGRHNRVFQKIISLDNLLLAWQEFKRGKIKKAEVQKFQFNLEDNIFNLQEKLENKTYFHGPYQPFYVYDPKLRHIHKASIGDRVIHQAVFRILYHYFDKQFIFHSYSCRLKKGIHLAVKNLEKFTRQVSLNYQQPIYALKCDVKKFFANIDQQILLSLIKKNINYLDTLWLIEKILFSFVEAPDKGLPLGNVTSQLFANIYLNELDQFIKHILKQRFYLRYCDDFIILSQNKEYLAGLIEPIDIFLKNKLKLTLHPDKIIIRKLRQGIDFLGYVTLPYYKVIRTKTKRRMLRLVNENNLHSYLGICQHASAHAIEKLISEKVDLRKK